MPSPSMRGVQAEDLAISADAQQSIIVFCAIVAIIFGLYNVCRVIAVKVHSYAIGDIEL